MKVIIPAAGPIALGYGFPRNPKPVCLHQYKGEVLLERQIRILQLVGLYDIRIVIGYRKELIENFIKEKGLSVEFVENLDAAKDVYATGGWPTFLVSLRKGLAGVDDDVIIIMSDVYLTLGGIKTLLEDKHKCVVLRDNHGTHVFKIAREFLPELRQLTGLGHNARLTTFCEERGGTIHKTKEHDIDYYRQTDEHRAWATSHLGIDWTHWCGLSLNEKKELLRVKGIKIEIYYDEFLIRIDGCYGTGTNYDVYGVEFDAKTNPKIGYADIVGDLLHWGHIEFLKRCKSMCDYLVVGVEPDETMRTNKRETVFPYEKRVEMIKELRCVDEVRRNLSWDATETLKQLVSEGYNLKFWFHGNDNEYPRAKEYIESVGGEAVITPYIKGISTTKIIETILKRHGVMKK